MGTALSCALVTRAVVPFIPILIAPAFPCSLLHHLNLRAKRISRHFPFADDLAKQFKYVEALALTEKSLSIKAEVYGEDAPIYQVRLMPVYSEKAEEFG